MSGSAQESQKPHLSKIRPHGRGMPQRFATFSAFAFVRDAFAASGKPASL
jgi:hypothetical protein